jgi:hypothetical protein
LARLTSKTVAPEVTLDLRGQPAVNPRDTSLVTISETEIARHRFVPGARRRWLQRQLIGIMNDHFVGSPLFAR